jgi:cytochrome P450
MIMDGIWLRGVPALNWGLRLVRDPLEAARSCHAAFGPFVILSEALPLARRSRVILLGIPLAMTASAALHREILEDPGTWRSASLMPGGPRGSAARRMSEGLIRMNGPRHAHYRRILAAPLRRPSVDAIGADMIRLAEREVATWPVGEVIDLWDYARRAMRSLTIGLLFGGDEQQGYPIADMIAKLTQGMWTRSVSMIRLNLPFTPYRRMVRDAQALERCILAWAETKRASADARDLAALVVNSPDVDGSAADSATIVGHIPSLYGGATEAGQSVLFWTLLLLAQHPRVARELVAELQECKGASLSMQDIQALPRLDAVLKESMRLIPPAPMQVRVAQDDTMLAGERLPKGTRAVLSTFLVNRMAGLYPEPDRFMPERWSTIDPTPFEYPVFGAGQRVCPGYWFGLSALKVALATILRHNRIAIAPDTRVDYETLPTMRPTARTPVTLHRQDGAYAAAALRGDIRRLVRA